MSGVWENTAETNRVPTKTTANTVEHMTINSTQGVYVCRVEASWLHESIGFNALTVGHTRKQTSPTTLQSLDHTAHAA